MGLDASIREYVGVPIHHSFGLGRCRAVAAVGAVVLLIAALHVFWTPLDVLWYKALRKADVVINT